MFKKYVLNIIKRMKSKRPKMGLIFKHIIYYISKFGIHFPLTNKEIELTNKEIEFISLFNRYYMKEDTLSAALKINKDELHKWLFSRNLIIAYYKSSNPQLPHIQKRICKIGKKAKKFKGC